MGSGAEVFFTDVGNGTIGTAEVVGTEIVSIVNKVCPFCTP